MILKLSVLKQKTRGGFTLVELIVVIAIIGILSSLVLPALSRARQGGRKAVCLSNLKQIGSALQIYSMDNDDYLPPSSSDQSTWPESTWAGILSTYVGNQKIFICPADKNPFDVEDLLGVEDIRVSYGYNSELADMPRKLNMIKISSNYLAFADGNTLEISPFDVSGEEYEEEAVGDDFEYRHLGGINFLAVDGHVEYRDHIPADDQLLEDLDGGL